MDIKEAALAADLITASKSVQGGCASSRLDHGFKSRIYYKIMRLNNISDNPGAVKKRIRVGRGPGSGKGKTAGRGIKGQKSRSGVSIKAFEGGQMPLYQRLPKRGFNSRNSKKLLDQVNLGSIQKLIDTKKIAENKPIDIELLRGVGLINKNAVSVKLLAKGTLASKVKIEVSSASQKAREAVEKTGGELNLIS